MTEPEPEILPIAQHGTSSASRAAIKIERQPTPSSSLVDWFRNHLNSSQISDTNDYDINLVFNSGGGDDQDISMPTDAAAITVDVDAEITPEEREKFLEDSNNTVNSDPAGLRRLKISVDVVADACKEIDKAFETLTPKVDLLDLAEGGERFHIELTKLKKKYQNTLDNSRNLAVEIAIYGERFEQVILRIVRDKTIENEIKIKKLDDHIAQSKQFEKGSRQIKKSFNDLTSEIDKLKTQTADLGDNLAIKLLSKKISTLKDDLSVLEVNRSVFGSGLVVNSIVIVFTIFGKLKLGGLIVSLCVVLVGLYLTCERIDEKTKEKRTMEERMYKVTAKLEGISKASNNETMLPGFNVGINTLSSAWVFTANDTRAIREWLAGGKEDLDLPPYDLTSFDQAAEMYSVITRYLRAYADGIQPATTTPTNPAPVGGSEKTNPNHR